MTKLRVLNAYLTERLMVAVREILEVVEGTVSEFQEEAARTHRENESLRRRLREVGYDTEADWPVLSSSLPSGAAHSPTEQQHYEQDWSCSLKEDTELTVNEEKQVPCEQQRTRHREELCDPNVSVSTGLGIPASHSTDSLTTPYVKTDHDQDSVQPPDHFKVQIVNTVHAPLSSSIVTDLIKTEPEEVYCGVSEAPTESFDPVGSECSRKSLDVNSVAGGPMSQPEIEQPKGKPRNVNGKRSHPCPQCEKTFSHVSRLKIHLRIHTGEKPYSCALCGKCFNNDGTLKNHQRVHTNVRLYSCKECGMSFKDAYTCKKHQRVHTGEKPYCCIHCGKHFNEVGNLQTHIRTHTGERPFCCSVCGKCFRESGKLKKHFRIHTREDSFLDSL